jgi:hypothetical protein
MADAHRRMAGPLRHIDDRAPICESGATPVAIAEPRTDGYSVFRRSGLPVRRRKRVKRNQSRACSDSIGTEHALVSAFHRPTGAIHGEAYKENLGEAEHQPQHSELEKKGERARSR